jgi:general secretion pathway protein C
MRRWALLDSPETLGRLAVPVNVLLVILVAHGLARLTWMLLPAGGPPVLPQSAPQTTAAVSTALSEATDYAVIADWHLFGRPNAAVPVPTPARSVPETRLNLRLAGVFFAENSAKGRALIAEAGGQELSYAVGDRLPGGARLEQILRDQVILSRRGALETLRLPQETSLNSAAADNAAALPTAQSAAAPPDNGNTPIDASALVGRLREDATTRPQALEDLAFASPYQQDGQFIGFRLRPGRDRKLMAQLGLRPGDVVTEVNGVRLVDPAQGLTVMQELLNADQIAIQVLRDGTEIPLTFALSAVTD